MRRLLFPALARAAGSLATLATSLTAQTLSPMLMSEVGPAHTISITLPVGRIIVMGSDLPDVWYSLQSIPPRPGIPFLSRLPHIGNLFSYSNTESDFLTDTTAARPYPVYKGVARSVVSEKNWSLLLPPPPSSLPDTVRFYGDARLVDPYLKGPITSSYSDAKNVGDSAAFKSFFEKIIAGRPAVRSDTFAGIEVRLTVPRNLSRLTLQILGQGTIAVQDFDGELTITNNDGDVYLGRIGGAALVETSRGNILLSASRVTTGRPISLMTGRGNVGLWVPKATKARVDLTLYEGKFESGTVQVVTPTTPGGVAFMLHGDKDPRNPVSPSEAGRIQLRSLSGNLRVELLNGTIPRWPAPPK